MSATIKVRMVNDPIEVMFYRPGKRALKVAKFLADQGAHYVDLRLYGQLGEFVILSPMGDPLPEDSYVGYGNPTGNGQRGSQVFAVPQGSLSGWVNPGDSIEAMVSAPRSDRGFEQVV